MMPSHDVEAKLDDGGNLCVECPNCGEYHWELDDAFEGREFEGEFECYACGFLINIIGLP